MANPLIEVSAAKDAAAKLAKMPCRNARNETLVCFVDEGEIELDVPNFVLAFLEMNAPRHRRRGGTDHRR